MAAWTQHLILFWVFVGFFVLLGLVALLAIVGIIQTEPRFRKWAVAGFAASVVGVVVVWAKTESALDFFVNLEPPANVAPETFELASGTYEYYDQSSTDKSHAHLGSIELTAGQQVGWWTAKFPYEGANAAVKLILKDTNGNWWAVRPFYPNYNRQTLGPTDAPQRTGAYEPTLIPISNSYAADSEIRFNNYAKAARQSQGRTYYDWRVFVDESASVLNQIAEVQYLLHPTFPNPLQVRTDPKDKFAVEASGWGQFTIQITIRYKNGSTRLANYQLDFNKAWPPD